MNMKERLPLNQKILSENDLRAQTLRMKFSEKKVVVLNLVSSPGSGKTSLLEKTLAALNDKYRLALIAGDVQTENDANRLVRAGGKIVRPIITGGACHLDALMVERSLETIDLNHVDLLFIENVGNLVCPSGFDLGEDMKVVLISTTEGDDKPLKYPAMFRRASAMVINKIDLLGLSDFDVARVRQNALKINGNLAIFEVSCRDGRGLEAFFAWLSDLVEKKKGRD